MQEWTDAELVERSARGEHAAFIELIRRHRGCLTALVCRLAGDSDRAEDLLQETVVRGYVSIGTLRNPDCARAWLLQVARNCWHDHRKSAVFREQPTENVELEWHINRFGRSAPPRHSAIELEEALGTLPAAEREAVQLFYVQGLSIKEMCAVTGSPAGTVKSRLFTARHHLRSFLGEEEGEDK